MTKASPFGEAFFIAFFFCAWYNFYMNDGHGGGEGEFARELSATFQELFHNLSAQIAGNERTERVLHVLFLLAALVLAGRAVYIIAKLIISERSYHSHRVRFESTRELMEDDELGGLVQACFELGRKVDRHTGRKHNSIQISRLAFDLAMALGVEKKLAAVYFCAAMVYDAGFLDLPEDLFYVDIFSGREKKLMRTHVQRSHSYFDFVPAPYYAEFAHAATYHHENIDGSGYPEGLKGDEIPLCARIIHLVESYVSLINPRSYHRRLAPKAALAELSHETYMYDEQVLEALAALVTVT